MRDIKDMEWFKKELAPTLKDYEIKYRFYDEGDFGSLNQIEFNSSRIGGNVDFWGLGLLGVFVWSYETETQLLNVLLNPDQLEEKNEVFEKLKILLQ